MIRIAGIQTPLGNMIAGATEEGLCLLEYHDRNKLPSEYKSLTSLLDTSIEKGENGHLEEVKRQLNEYFAGLRKEFSVPLIFPGTDFQKMVWKELRNIPYGETISYHDLSVTLNCPAAIRAIAHANGMNRISIIIPCHRVIGSDGSLTGYGGGLARKKWLIDHEKKYSGKATELSLF